MFVPALLIVSGFATLWFLSTSGDRPVPVNEPDSPAQPGSTRYKLVDKILPELRKASESSGIPLGLLVGWIARESGGRIGEVTKKYDERGYFQLMPAESKKLGVDHQRLSTDPVYSINAGLLLIALYMRAVDALEVARRGSAYYWMLVKLAHTMGSGALKIIVNGAKAENEARSWEDLKRHALANEKKYLSSTKHSPSKWFPLVDKVREVGEPFGFGTSDAIVGAALPEFADIVDPLDCLAKR